MAEGAEWVAGLSVRVLTKHTQEVCGTAASTLLLLLHAVFRAPDEAARRPPPSRSLVHCYVHMPIALRASARSRTLAMLSTCPLLGAVACCRRSGALYLAMTLSRML